MSRTTLWHVCLVTTGTGHRIIVGRELPAVAYNDYQRIRTISPRAAARNYLRGRFVTACYLADDGINEPADLRKPSVRKFARKWAKRLPVKIEIAK